jgi:CubicO group peptidase (beta-lactamase class C family)
MSRVCVLRKHSLLAVSEYKLMWIAFSSHSLPKRTIKYILTMFSMFVTLLLAQTAACFRPCPIFGPAFPAPQNLSHSSTILAAIDGFTSLLNSVLSTARSKYGSFDSNTTTFSLEVFSANVDDPLFQYHHNGPGLGYSGVGVEQVDSNTIYRIGSVTKLLTVYSFLVAAGDVHFQDPVTKWVPELLAASSALPSIDDPVKNVAWQDITIGQLASHMSGIGRESRFVEDSSSCFIGFT